MKRKEIQNKKAFACLKVNVLFFRNKSQTKTVRSGKCLRQGEQSNQSMTLLWWNDLQTGKVAVSSEIAKH